jgi:hypothetical protein
MPAPGLIWLPTLRRPCPAAPYGMRLASLADLYLGLLLCALAPYRRSWFITMDLGCQVHRPPDLRTAPP